MRRSAGVFLLLLLLILQLGAVQAQAGRVRLVTGPEYSPLVSPDISGGHLATDLTLAAFEAAGIAVEPIEFLPWKRGYQAVLDGAFDATFPYIEAPGRDREMLYSTQVYEVQVWPTFRSDLVRPYIGPESLAGLTLCEPIGWAPPPRLRPLLDGRGLHLIEDASLQVCARQLMAGRADLLVVSEAQFETIAHQDWGEGLRPVLGDHPVATNPQFLIAARSNPAAPELLAHFSAGLEQLRADGRYQAILQRHQGNALVNGVPGTH